MPLKRAEALVHIDQDFNIVFPMQDKTSKKLVSCVIPMQSMGDVYGAPPGEEIVTFGRFRSAIEAVASAEYDRRQGYVAPAAAATRAPRQESLAGSAMMAMVEAAFAAASGARRSRQGW